MAFGPGAFIEQRVLDVATIVKLRDTYPTLWVDVVQFGDAGLISELGQAFNLHSLALEDAINTHQRPKVEQYDDHLFIVALMPDSTDTADTEQVAFFIGDGYLVTFQERTGDCFERVRERLRKGTERMRAAGSDYVCLNRPGFTGE